MSSDVRDLALPLRDDPDLDPLLDRVGDAKVVLLGEASHGTQKYYLWREPITRRLIAEKGFGFVAVEGDWPDCYRVNRFVRLHPGAPADPREVLNGFHRWPTWMWANEETVGLTRWLRQPDAALPEAGRVGFGAWPLRSRPWAEVLTRPARTCRPSASAWAPRPAELGSRSGLAS